MIRFKRSLESCDQQHDRSITVSQKKYIDYHTFIEIKKHFSKSVKKRSNSAIIENPISKTWEIFLLIKTI